ncbi:MAG TPA: type II toxin-antitoxin system VapC family toxin [Longimicrobiaceae bacterium]
MSGEAAPEPKQYPTVYVETTVVSYLAANPSGDAVTRGLQKSTQSWWANRARWDLLTSTAVVGELVKGDHRTAVKRLELLAGIPLLTITPETKLLAAELLRRGPLPPKARVDADHISIAAVYGVAYIVTWNLKHIANPAIRRRVDDICRAAGYRFPVACTPEELLASVADAKRSHR